MIEGNIAILPAAFFNMGKFLNIGLFVGLLLLGMNVLAADVSRNFYLGAMLGWGTTTWNYLVDRREFLAQLVTPDRVHEGGMTCGLFAGYQFTSFIALELQYLRCPRAKIYFAPLSWYVVMDGVSEVNSNTDAYSLAMKVMAPVFHTPIKVFALAGGAMEHRADKLAKRKINYGGTFGAGLRMPISNRIFAELIFQYYTGYGQTNIIPVYKYMPFIYTVDFSLAYRFGGGA